MINSFIAMLHPSILLFLTIGVSVGMVVGALPGLSATMAIAILTPLTFWLAPEQGFAVLIGIYNSAIFAGGISAILINTPGTPASIASSFDGYSMTKQGKGGLALGVNVIYSVLGGLISTVVLAVFSFPLASLAMKFGAAEYFSLAVFGLALMASVSGGAPLKGLIMGLMGMMLATVGMDPILGAQRFTFDNLNLIDGLSFVPIMIGVFGVGEVLTQIYDEFSNRSSGGDVGAIGRILPNRKEIRKTIPGSLFAGIVSPIIGAIPGAGGDIASIICWDQAKRMSKEPEKFGEGSIEGLASTCLANNGVIGGALTTMLTLGIPGDSVTAILIGALMMYGMIPGPKLFAENPGFVYGMISLMVLANLCILVMGLLGAKLSSKILSVRKEYIWSTVLIFSVIGSYSLQNSYFDIVVVGIAGITGFLFRKMGFPLGPFILGILLGKLAESNLRRALLISGGSYSIFVTRPISLLLLGITFLVIITPIVKELGKSFKEKKEKAEKTMGLETATGNDIE